MSLPITRSISLRPGARRSLTFSVLCATAIAAGCGGGDGPTGPPDPPQVASILVTPGADTLIAVGRTRTYVAVAREADGTAIPGATIRWRSSDTLVARVDSLTGVVTAVANGGATISSVSGTVTGTGTVSVIQFVAAVQVTPGASGLAAIGATQPYAAVARDSANAIVPGVRFLWISSNPAVATIDTNGVALAVGPGTTTISASGRGVPAYATLTVTQAAAALAFVVEPTSVRAGTAFPTALQVEVRDASGFIVRDSRAAVTVIVSTGPPGAEVHGSQTVNAVNGIATLSGLWLSRASTGYRIRATSPGIAPDTSVAFDVRPGLPARMALTEAPVGTAEAADGSAALRVAFYDAYDNPTDTTLATTLALDGPFGLHNELSHGAPQVIDAHQVRFPSIRFSRPSVVRLRATAQMGPTTLAATTDQFRVRTTYTDISIGLEHGCGVAGGAVFCWGSNRQGRLLSRDPGITTHDSTPGRIAAAEQFTKVVADTAQTCALTTTGAVRCWGAGGNRLMAGTGSGSMVMTSISGKSGHVCGVSTVGAVYCWGDNFWGQSGHAAGFTSDVPVLVTGTGPGGLVFSSVSAGNNHTCGIAQAGTAYCWGRNHWRQLGDSTLPTSQNAPIQVLGSGSGSFTFKAITAGGDRTCAINEDDEVYCWGRAYVGDGTADFAPSPRLVFLQGTTPWTGLSMSNLQTCAHNGFAIACWGGGGDVGVLGPEAQSNELTPVYWFGGTPNLLQLDAGPTTTCLRYAERVSCVGANANGVLGLGSMALTTHRQPVTIIQ